MKGYLTPETPRVTPSPSTAKCWSCMRMVSDSTRLPMEGDLTPSPPEPRYLFGIPDNLYDAGKATVSKVPELCPFVHLPCPSHQSLGSISNLGTCGYYTVLLLPSISECLNPKLEALQTKN